MDSDLDDDRAGSERLDMASQHFASIPHPQDASTSFQSPATFSDFQLPPGYTLSNNNWYYTPPDDASTSSPGPSFSVIHSNEPNKNFNVVDGSEERDESLEPLEESLPPPPHDPDELAPIAVLRSCTMAGSQIPAHLRCPVLLKADYTFKMCDSCRMRFKLADLRARGIRYEGKKVAREKPGERRQGRGRGKKTFKPRPQLIEFNGELVLDPAYMHTYELDPKMFGPQGAQETEAAKKEAEFKRSYKAALHSMPKKLNRKSVSATPEGNPNQAPSESPIAPPDEAPTPSVSAPSDPSAAQTSQQSVLASNTTHPTLTNDVLANTPSAELTDGLLRVRICSVKNCHKPIPVDYFWKMCETCRINYRAWGVAKRAKKREKRLEVLPQEERDKREAVRLRNKARYEARLRGEETDDEQFAIPLPFDPTIPPRPCSQPKCKHHVPGNSHYKRCELHRKVGHNEHNKTISKREQLREVYRKATEEGNDPEEALRNELAKMSAHNVGIDSSDDDGERNGATKDVTKTKHGKVKRKRGSSSANVDPLLLTSPFTTSPHPVERASKPGRPGAKRKAGEHICGSKECQNLLDPNEPLRHCEHCREREHVSRAKKVSEAEVHSLTSTSVPTYIDPALVAPNIVAPNTWPAFSIAPLSSLHAFTTPNSLMMAGYTTAHEPPVASGSMSSSTFPGQSTFSVLTSPTPTSASTKTPAQTQLSANIPVTNPSPNVDSNATISSSQSLTTSFTVQPPDITTNPSGYSTIHGSPATIAAVTTTESSEIAHAIREITVNRTEPKNVSPAVPASIAQHPQDTVDDNLDGTSPSGMPPATTHEDNSPEQLVQSVPAPGVSSEGPVAVGQNEAESASENGATLTALFTTAPRLVPALANTNPTTTTKRRGGKPRAANPRRKEPATDDAPSTPTTQESQDSSSSSNPKQNTAAATLSDRAAGSSSRKKTKNNIGGTLANGTQTMRPYHFYAYNPYGVYPNQGPYSAPQNGGVPSAPYAYPSYPPYYPYITPSPGAESSGQPLPSGPPNYPYYSYPMPPPGSGGTPSVLSPSTIPPLPSAIGAPHQDSNGQQPLFYGYPALPPHILQHLPQPSPPSAPPKPASTRPFKPRGKRLKEDMPPWSTPAWKITDMTMPLAAASNAGTEKTPPAKQVATGANHLVFRPSTYSSQLVPTVNSFTERLGAENSAPESQSHQPVSVASSRRNSTATEDGSNFVREITPMALQPSVPKAYLESHPTTDGRKLSSPSTQLANGSHRGASIMNSHHGAEHLRNESVTGDLLPSKRKAPAHEDEEGEVEGIIQPESPDDKPRESLGESNGNLILVHDASKRVCASAPCDTPLLSTYLFKQCIDCRKKAKLKKRVTEMKRRLKLTKRVSIDKNERHVADDDDAEGEVDVDVC